MRRIAAAALTAALLPLSLLATAGPASAQNPGRSGEHAYALSNIEFVAPCSDLGRLRPQGGIAFAPSGREMAFTAAEPIEPAPDSFAPAGLYTVPLDTCSTPKRVAGVDKGSTASYSPDGRQLAIQSGGRVKIVTSGGSYVRDLGPGRDPSWDPTGRGIAFVASDGIRITAPTGGTSRLWKKGAVTAPDYSPDGSKIAYLAGGRITYADTATGGSVRTTPITALQFAWSPDGRQFLFLSPRYTVIVANVSGLITERLDTPEIAEHPAWQPVP